MSKTENSNVIFPFLSKLELKLLTPEQAKELNKFSRQQWRRDKVYEARTVCVRRTILEDRTPNGSMDRYGKLAIGCNSLGLKDIDAQIATALAHGHTQVGTAELLGLTRRQVEYRIDQMRACPWYSWWKSGTDRDREGAHNQVVASQGGGRGKETGTPRK